MALTIQKATKKQSKLRIAFDGPAGSGKTMTSLRVARGLVGPAGKIGVIDTERGSASLYSNKIQFDVIVLDSYSPDNYIEAIHAFEAAGYDVIIIDSLSHGWEGKGGALEMKDNAERRTGNGWTAWRDVTPKHNALVDAMLQSRCHIIVTMRSKMEHVQEKDERGKTVIKKIGMAPIQRPGLEYEFTVVGDIDTDHKMVISKTRCDALDRAVIERPGEALGEQLLSWLNDGEAAAANEAPPPTLTVAAPAPASLSAELAAAIAATTTQPQLAEIADRILKAHSSQQISDAERAELRPLYAAKHALLAQRAA